MNTIKGPALFLAQCASDAASFDPWDSITTRTADCGHVGVQVPSRGARLFDVEPAAASEDCFGENVHDGVTFEMLLERFANHDGCNMLCGPSHHALQAIDGLDHIDICHDRIRMFHVKDPALNSTGRQGVHGDFQPWVNRAGRFRSPGGGQVVFGRIFSKLMQYGFDGWAVVEWECGLKHPENGARAQAPSRRQMSSGRRTWLSTTSPMRERTGRQTGGCRCFREAKAGGGCPPRPLLREGFPPSRNPPEDIWTNVKEERSWRSRRHM